MDTPWVPSACPTVRNPSGYIFLEHFMLHWSPQLYLNAENHHFVCWKSVFPPQMPFWACLRVMGTEWYLGWKSDLQPIKRSFSALRWSWRDHYSIKCWEKMYTNGFRTVGEVAGTHGVSIGNSFYFFPLLKQEPGYTGPPTDIRWDARYR